MFLPQELDQIVLSSVKTHMDDGETYKFLDFELVPGRHELRRLARLIAVEPQVFDLIALLVRRQGMLVSRDEILDAVWAGGIASDASISTRINAARSALGDDGKTQFVIKTVPRRGFIFLPDVTRSVTGKNAITDDHAPALSGNSPSIAIMPFTAIGDDGDSRSLADGLRIDIQNALVKVSGLFLSAIGSVNAVAEFERDEAAKRLDVTYLLHAQVRRMGDKMRVSFQLEDARNGTTVWSESFDGEVSEAFELLDKIVAKVLTALNVKLIAGEAGRIWHKTFTDLDGLGAFYRGVSRFFEMSEESLALARKDFEWVSARYPNSPIGATWVSLTHWYDFQRGWRKNAETSKRLAREWAAKAVEFEDHDGQACTVLSHVHLIEGDFDAALASGASAVENRPNCAHANGFYANVLHYCGRQPQAGKHIDLAMRHAPIHPPLFPLIKANVCRLSSDVTQARDLVRQVLSKSSDDVGVLFLDAVLSAEAGGPDRARTIAAVIEKNSPDFDFHDFIERLPYQDVRHKDHLKEVLKTAGI